MRRFKFSRALIIVAACFCLAPGEPAETNHWTQAAGAEPVQFDSGLQAGILVSGKIGDAYLLETGWAPEVPASAR